MTDNTLAVKSRVFLERFSLWGVRYFSMMTFLGVAWLNWDQGNYAWFFLCFVGGLVTFVTAFIDYKRFVGRETSIFLSRSQEWRDMRADIKRLLHEQA